MAILVAYRQALEELLPCTDPRRLLDQVGSVDREASHPATRMRLRLVGRLIAAAQLAAAEPLAEREVRDAVRTWLLESQAERDDAAPVREPRVPPEEEHISGLDRSLLECDRHGGLSAAAWAIAALILGHFIRPPMEISRTLALSAGLELLAAKVLRVVSDASPFGLGGDELNGFLAHTAVHVRRASRTVRSGGISWETKPAQDWVHIAAGSVAAHAAWAEVPAASSTGLALARATERLASSLVPDDPSRFPLESALDHAADAAFDAAVTALGLSVHPGDAILRQIKPDVQDALLEAASSALIGAWVLERRAQA